MANIDDLFRDLADAVFNFNTDTHEGRINIAMATYELIHRDVISAKDEEIARLQARIQKIACMTVDKPELRDIFNIAHTEGHVYWSADQDLTSWNPKQPSETEG